MSVKTDLDKIIFIAGEAIGNLLNHDPKEAERLFREMSEILLKSK